MISMQTRERKDKNNLKNQTRNESIQNHRKRKSYSYEKKSQFAKSDLYFVHPKIIQKGKGKDMLEFAKTPPKGWNSWDVYGASVTEEEVKRNADIMAEKLKVYGWDYVVVDIQWYEPGAESAAYRKFADLKMDEYSRVLPAENRFPSSADGAGFAPLAEYVHKLGLKFGIHILRGIPRQAVHGRMHIKGTDKITDHGGLFK